MSCGQLSVGGFPCGCPLSLWWWLSGVVEALVRRPDAVWFLCCCVLIGSVHQV